MCFATYFYWKRQNWPYFVQSLHQQNWIPILDWFCCDMKVWKYTFLWVFFFSNLWFKWLKQLQQMNLFYIASEKWKKKKKKKSHHFHPDTLETVICCQIAGSLQFLGSFGIADSRWIPSSGGCWYCKPAPSVSNSSLSLVIQSLPVITLVSQCKPRAAKEEYKCVHTSELSWISWISPFSGVQFICNNLVVF